MPLYLISFNEGAMQIPLEELATVTREALGVIRQVRDAGVYVCAGGLVAPAETCVVAVDGSVREGPDPAQRDFLGGFTVVDVPDRDQALHWAAKLAAACRCAQDVRELMPEPEPEPGA